MYTLKSIAQRGTMLGAAVALVAAAVIPGATALADSLNPLTERSLLLSSSAPGFMDSDGAGNSESNPNAWNGGEYYALPGSGPNGKKSGETFTFRVSTDSSTTGTSEPLKAITLQYCTAAAGNCQAPGNNAGDASAVDNSDAVRTPDRMNNAAAHALPTPTSDFDVVTDGTTAWAEDTVATVPGTPGTYRVLVNGALTTGWVMSTSNSEDVAHSGALTGTNNYITLKNTAGIEPVFNDKIEVKFTPNTKNYITNPGAGSFFVKINTYKSDSAVTAGNIIDGGVTVANVMTDSIHITTKVLETMSFSVGTENPDTKSQQHGSCDPMTVVANNRLNLGDPDAESSLSTQRAFDAHSYWRLSSNSSGGATVYYSGDTLRNTVGDSIKDMASAGVPARAHSQPGTEQFGLALVNAGLDEMDTDPVTSLTFPANHILPNIAPLNIQTPYAGGDVADISKGVGTGNGVTADNAEFAFTQTSKSVPAVIAQNSDQVISCATSKVRYVGNIAADTPAGVYTTKINYLAAPQY